MLQSLSTRLRPSRLIAAAERVKNHPDSVARLDWPHDPAMGNALCVNCRRTWLVATPICYFKVRSKADMSQLNLPHGTRQLKV